MAGHADSEAGAERRKRDGLTTDRTKLGGASALLAAVALIGLTEGRPLVAVLGGLAVVASWLLLAPTSAFALGHVALAAVLPANALASGVPLELLAVEVGLVGMLLASATRRGVDAGGSVALAVGVVLAWTFGGGALAWIAARSGLDLWLAGALVVGASGLAAYGLHRYQLVSLGLVGETDE
ncbi:hypothetical protein [Halorussus ruber]|uniref:hypothetical protein n=1 Tax=Halorussus ruber TaxID=1126238 RepID=UPI001092A695|nr:hypothetical protein [Halorussus ruber]